MPTKAAVPIAMIASRVRGENSSPGRFVTVSPCVLMPFARSCLGHPGFADQAVLIEASAIDLLVGALAAEPADLYRAHQHFQGAAVGRDRKSTRLNSSHSQISYAVFCLKKKK